jgi:hypothetical protein
MAPAAFQQAGAHFSETLNGWITYAAPYLSSERRRISSNQDLGTLHDLYGASHSGFAL